MLRSFTRLACMLVFGATMLGAGGQALADKTRVFRDWTVSCWDQDERCAAETDITARTDRTPYNLTLTVARQNGMATGWQASMRLRGVAPRPGSDIILQVDDRDPFFFTDRADYRRARGGQTIRFADHDKVARLLAAMHAGNRLYVTFMSTADRETGGDFSLRGVIASLLWMDEQQNRVGSSSIVAPSQPQPAESTDADAQETEDTTGSQKDTAAAQPTPQPAAPDTLPAKPVDQTAEPPAPVVTAPAVTAPATETPGAPDAPQQTTPQHMAQIEQDERPTDATSGKTAAPNGIPPVTLPDTLLKKHYAESACEKLGTNVIDPRLATIAPLTRGKILYVIPCFSGAYNIAYRLYVVRNDEFATARTLFFANYSPSLGWYGSDTLINVSYNPETHMLSAFGKGRSAGDCGNTALYRWDDYDFRMLEYRAWDRCDGSRQPDEWPVVFEVKD